MIEVSTQQRVAEVSWFSALCSDDYEYLGVPDPALRSSFAHCGEIVRLADHLGYDNILLPSSYQVGQDPLTFAGGVAPSLERLALLVAIRCGEVHPPMLARALSTLDHMLDGRLTVNIISSDLPGETVDSAARYRRSAEVIEILKQAWTRERIDFDGEFYQLSLETTDPVAPYQQNGGPLLYFGGYSPHARTLCARHCDVYLMWPDTEDGLEATMQDISAKAREHERVLDYGLRIHVVVRKSSAEARAAAARLMSRLDAERGAEIKGRAQDSVSAGVLRQDALRDASEDDYIEPNVWSGIGRARSGCASALVGDPDEIYDKIQRYLDLGIRAFIFSGYPHLDECRYFADLVLPRLERGSLPRLRGRLPETVPATPLTHGERR
ncbi:MAG: LLM class flavin-dependent oxidoreductase [Acidobacteriota bacterium]